MIEIKPFLVLRPYSQLKDLHSSINHLHFQNIYMIVFITFSLFLLIKNREKILNYRHLTYILSTLIVISQNIVVQMNTLDKLTFYSNTPIRIDFYFKVQWPEQFQEYFQLHTQSQYCTINIFRIRCFVCMGLLEFNM